MKKNIFFFKLNNENVYIFITSFLSKTLSKYSNYFFNFASIPMNYIKLKGDLQPTLRSLGQFMFTKINDYICYLTINDIFLN
jgi:hypothetical protein